MESATSAISDMRRYVIFFKSLPSMNYPGRYKVKIDKRIAYLYAGGKGVCGIAQSAEYGLRSTEKNLPRRCALERVSALRTP
jgi:hypothetical protein